MVLLRFVHLLSFLVKQVGFIHSFLFNTFGEASWIISNVRSVPHLLAEVQDFVKEWDKPASKCRILHCWKLQSNVGAKRCFESRQIWFRDATATYCYCRFSQQFLRQSWGDSTCKTTLRILRGSFSLGSETLLLGYLFDESEYRRNLTSRS